MALAYISRPSCSLACPIRGRQPHVCLQSSPFSACGSAAQQPALPAIASMPMSALTCAALAGPCLGAWPATMACLRQPAACTGRSRHARWCASSTSRARRCTGSPPGTPRGSSGAHRLARHPQTSCACTAPRMHAADMEEHWALAQRFHHKGPALDLQSQEGMTGFEAPPQSQQDEDRDVEATQAGARHLSRAKQKKKASLHT